MSASDYDNLLLANGTEGEWDDDLRAWVEATAPKLEGDDWSGLRVWARERNLATPHALGDRVCAMRPEQRDALLAYVDELARGLPAHVASGLLTQWMRPLWTFTTTQRRALAPFWREQPTEDEDQRNDLGRVVAERTRELKGGEGC